jgi:hypothetical protein
MTEQPDELQRWLSTYGKESSPKPARVGAAPKPKPPVEEQFPVADTVIIQKRPGGFAGLRRMLSSSSRTPEPAES